ncbi:MAG: ornithine carbamoyltransferase [Candidatus Hydrogenedentes bacterium]|nr:ornithine carbamoyltransferase [Candidatus Hydrogenedentota bacterium]
MPKDMISLADWTTDEIVQLLDLAADLKDRLKRGIGCRLLAGRTLALIFEKPSLRTRVTFEVGMYQLGGASLLLNPDQIQLGVRETVSDCALNLERWVDGIMARTFAHQTVLELAESARIPVVNGLTDLLHPCQILADLLTVREHVGSLDGVKIAFVGDGNNIVNSWLNAAARLPIDFSVACPKGYEPNPEIVRYAKENATGRIVVTSDVAEAVKDADVVYTDVWTSMGQEDEAEKRRSDFAGYCVDADVMSVDGPNAIVMHCLPAHRGEEISSDVLDGSQSVVFDQAENRLHAQKSVLVRLFLGEFPESNSSFYK